MVASPEGLSLQVTLGVPKKIPQGYLRFCCLTIQTGSHVSQWHPKQLHPSSQHVSCKFLLVVDNRHEGGHYLSTHQCHV